MRQRRLLPAILLASCLLFMGYLYVYNINRMSVVGHKDMRPAPVEVVAEGYFGGVAVKGKSKEEKEPEGGKKGSGTKHTFDGWPEWPNYPYKGPIPESPYHPTYNLAWDFDTSSLLQRPDVIGKPPKLMTWMVKPRYYPVLKDPVRMRLCPEMPCRMTTNAGYAKESALLMYNGEIMSVPTPPARSSPDQVFLFHNHEPQQPNWINRPSFRKPAWKSAFNWTMTYRFDSDIVDLYGYLAKRENPPAKNYTDILVKKNKFAAWLVSNCHTFGKRMEFVKRLQKYVSVDIFGGCGPHKCPRSKDDACFKTFSTKYKFYLSFENAICQDYVSEKFFRYMETDAVVVARGNGHRYLAPNGTYINTDDFSSIKKLADYLLYLDAHPEEYIKILKAKDAYIPLYEDYPIRNAKGDVQYMAYHYEAVSFCEICRRLWNLDQYRKTIPDITQWFDKGNCYPPTDIKET